MALPRVKVVPPMEARMLGAERTAERRALERKRVAAIVSVSMCVVGIEWYCGLGGVVDRKKSSVSIGSDEGQKLAQSRRRHACAKHRLRFAEEAHGLRSKLTTTTTKMNIISAISCNFTTISVDYGHPAGSLIDCGGLQQRRP